MRARTANFAGCEPANGPNGARPAKIGINQRAKPDRADPAGIVQRDTIHRTNGTLIHLDQLAGRYLSRRDRLGNGVVELSCLPRVSAVITSHEGQVDELSAALQP